MKLNIGCLRPVYWWCRTRNFTPSLSRFFMHAISYENKNFDLKEPFKGLFTQGMVCHETYKDPNNNWISPDEIEVKNGKKYLERTIQLNKVELQNYV